MNPVFYVADGPAFVPSEWTRGPWDARHQHAGPPAALLARAMEEVAGGADFAVVRFTMEVLRSVPLNPLRVEAAILRPGRSVQLAEATMLDGDGVIALGRAWLVRRGDTEAERSALEPPPFAGADELAAIADFDPWDGPSYFSAVEWRAARGDFATPGPAAVWMRMRGALVDGEDPTPLTRVLVAADSGNGVSSELSWRTHLFVNIELTVHLFREPQGEWICLDAVTRIGPRGAGMAQSNLFDTRGRFGTALQALLVRPR